MAVCRYMVTCPKWPECRHGGFTARDTLLPGSHRASWGSGYRFTTITLTISVRDTARGTNTTGDDDSDNSDRLTYQLTSNNQPCTNLICTNAHTTLANGTASGTIIHSSTHTTLTTNITTTPQGSGLAGKGTAEHASHHPHTSPTLSYTAPQHRPPASPDRTCAAAHCWDDDYNVLPAIRHLLAATAPRPRAHQQPTEPQEPDHPMPERSISPASTADQNAEHQREEPEPDRAATPPPPPPPPPKDI